jgi:hypothetical protein
MQWDLDISQSAVVVSVVATGDYNGSGVVDAADYVLWRNLVGQTGNGLAADGNGSGVVDAADYEIWRRNFGRAVSTRLSAVAAIPEPATFLLVVFSLLMAPRCARVEQVPSRAAAKSNRSHRCAARD